MTKDARIYNGVKTISSLSDVAKLDRHKQKNETRQVTLYTKINSK